MSNLDPATIFYADTGLDPGRTERLVSEALNGCDDGELYLQYAVSESFSFDDGRLKAATFDTDAGLWPARRGRRNDRLCPCQ